MDKNKHPSILPPLVVSDDVTRVVHFQVIKEIPEIDTNISFIEYCKENSQGSSGKFSTISNECVLKVETINLSKDRIESYGIETKCSVINDCDGHFSAVTDKNDCVDINISAKKEVVQSSSKNADESCDGASVEECHLCDICRKQFSSKSSLSVHYGCHPQTNIYKCQFCDETFIQAADFADHYTEHCYEEQYDCITCNETFTDKAKFEAHTHNHELTLKDHVCDICECKFLTEGNLAEHQKLHFIKPFSCLLCAKTFRLKSSLNRHMLIHGDSKPFKCEICDRGFTQKVTLKKHYLGHEKIKPYNCELCDRSFTSKPSLELHYVYHSGEKPYTCFVCDRSFTSRRNLKRHGMEHMPGQRSTCEVCSKVFLTKSKLKHHFLIHTNDRPYKCNMCNRGFSYSSHLKRHIMWHNGERPFVCKFCGKDFPSRFRLKGHLEKHAASLDFEPYDELHLEMADDLDDMEGIDVDDDDLDMCDVEEAKAIED